MWFTIQPSPSPSHPPNPCPHPPNPRLKDSHNISLVSGMYKLKYSLLLDDTNLKQSVFSICHYFTEALKEIHYVKGTVFISQDLLQTSVISSSLWLIREDFKGTVFTWGKTLNPTPLKVSIYSTEPVATIFVCIYPILLQWTCDLEKLATTISIIHEV